MSLRDKIEGAKDRNAECVEVPEWGCDVYIGIISGEQRAEWSRFVVDNCKPGAPEPKYVRERLVASALCDEDGAQVFPDTEAGWKALAKRNTLVVERLFDKAIERNGLNKQAVDDAEKNSESAPSSDSGTS